MVTRPIPPMNPWYYHLVLLTSNPRSNLRRDSDLALAFLFLILLINGQMSFLHSPNRAQRLFDFLRNGVFLSLIDRWVLWSSMNTCYVAYF
jgi:fumarate reductase subunit C